MESATADNCTSSAKPIAGEAGNTTARLCAEKARGSASGLLTRASGGYCACGLGDFFFGAEPFCVVEEVFCPEPVGAWRTSPQGSSAFCAGILLVGLIVGVDLFLLLFL